MWVKRRLRGWAFVGILLYTACSADDTSRARIGDGEGDASRRDAQEGSARSADARADSEASADGAPSEAAPDGTPCASNGDYSRDAHNCGYCGHDCLGGQCAAGHCQPVILSSSESNPSAITANSTGCYWANQGTDAAHFADGSIRFVANSSQAPVTIVPNLKSPVNVISNEEAVYFFTDGTLLADSSNNGDGAVGECSSNGCGGKPAFLRSDIRYTYSPCPGVCMGFSSTMALNATRIFWVADGYVESCPTSGCSGAPVRVAPGNPGILAADDDNVYASFVPGAFVRRAPALGGNWVTLVNESKDFVQGMFVDSGAMYLLRESRTFSLTACALPNCTNGRILLPASDAGSLSTFVFLAQDPDSLFWWDSTSMLMTCSKASCVPTPLAPWGTQPYRLAVSDKVICAIAGGEVRRLAR